jgi:hypothetical protein
MENYIPPVDLKANIWRSGTAGFEKDDYLADS